MARTEGRNPPTRRYSKIGRPTRYRPAMCAVAVDWLAQGYSLGSLAGQLGTCRHTLNLWVKQYPEFGAAVACGRARGLAVWEQRLAEAARRKSSCIQFALRNLSPDDWGDGRRGLVRDEPQPMEVTVTFVRPDGSVFTPGGG